MSKLFLIPLVLFAVLIVFLAIGLGHDPHKLPSALIDKPAPDFALPELRDPGKIISPNQLHNVADARSCHSQADYTLE